MWDRTFRVGDLEEYLEVDTQRNSSFTVPAIEVSLDKILKDIRDIEVETI